MAAMNSWNDPNNHSLHRVPDRFADALAGQFAAPRKAKAEPANIDGFVLNTRPDPIDFRDRIYDPGLVRLEPFRVPPPMETLGLYVRSQGSEGSCTGQALAAVIDLQNIERFMGGLDVPRRVSERMLYEQARAFDEFAEDRLPGSSARGAIKGFFHRGVCSAELAPYVDGDTSFQLTVELAKNARQVTLGSYFRLRHVLNDYHAALNEAGAIFCTAMVHKNWRKENLEEGWVRFPDNPADIELIGGHAFAIVGYCGEGFIVLNSWGADWGGLQTSSVTKVSVERPSIRLPGMALWTYADWRAHVLDAWVLRLQAPTNLPSGYVGGFNLSRTPQRDNSPSAITTTVPASAVDGHYVHVRNGQLVNEAPYNNDLAKFRETAAFLAKDDEPDKDKRYDHLLFFAHGGLNDLDSAVARANAMTPGFKRNGIYPVFFIWRTGLGDSAKDLIRQFFGTVAERAAGLSDISDAVIERVAAGVGRALWTDMKLNAELCFKRQKDLGEAWDGARILLDAAAKRKNHPLSVHFVGHSAGAIFLGRLFERAKAESFDLPGMTRTLSLFAPACTTDFFNTLVAPFAAKLKGKAAAALYDLSDGAERADNVSGIYRKSLLYLVSNAFETQLGMPIAGMETFFDKLKLPASTERYIADPGKNPASTVSASTSHGGFDNDHNTVNHVLTRILNMTKAQIGTRAFTSSELQSSEF